MNAPIRDWVFDLDNTLYPAEATLYAAIGERMTDYIERALACGRDEAHEIRERYFHMYGATVLGLAKHHAIDAADFLDDVHKVDMSAIGPDPDLAAMIAALPGRKFIFTNGAESYGRRVAERLGLKALFADIVGIDPHALKPKPERAAFERLIKRCRIAPRDALVFDDHERNLETARQLGFRTVLIGTAERSAHADWSAPDLKNALRAFAPL